ELVQESLGGNRDAFGLIVTRYQSLICSLAYSSTGDLGRSEDLAQETFFAAWKQLKALREPEKLKSWLCGIVRNLTSGARRRDGREPSHRAEEIGAAGEPVAGEPLPADQAVSSEEAALLWSSLERIPEVYREPLILFYRQHQSIEQVASGLDLTEDAVKQRLSRGRKLLQEQMLAVIEGTLGRTAPSAVFTASVMGALPLASAGAGLGALTGATTKGVLFSAASILLGPGVGFLSAFLGFKMEMAQAQSDAERRLIRRFAARLWAFIILTLIVPLALCVFGRAILHGHFGAIPWVIGGFAGLYGGILGVLFVSGARERRRMEAAGLLRGLDTPQAPVFFEYRSRATLLGVPLIHIAWTRRIGRRKPPARGWIACGNQAYGLLMAFGTVAVAPVSFGAFSIGLLSWGCCAFGVYAMGGLSLGMWAVGCIALGWNAMGALVLGGHIAQGGWVASEYFVRGAFWYAPRHLSPAEWNLAQAQAERFSNFSEACLRVLSAVWIGSGILYWRFVARVRRRRLATAGA
ncbi:MAG TPA: RNA polymerase sigma factor, partial [Opitutaceae bacterium]|nr:RNA polymerase sigma factor [Opitutaceae bacterium]